MVCGDVAPAGEERISGEMKALTMTQPWASLVALGHKRVETRSWQTINSSFSTIAVHAAKGFPAYAREFAEEERALGRLPARLPFGAVVAVARVLDCRRTEAVAGTLSGLERRLGDYSWGRWAWMLGEVYALAEPVPCRGALGLWRLPEDVLEAVRAQRSKS
jgi:hypothetical protein